MSSSQPDHARTTDTEDTGCRMPDHGRADAAMACCRPRARPAQIERQRSPVAWWRRLIGISANSG